MEHDHISEVTIAFSFLVKDKRILNNINDYLTDKSVQHALHWNSIELPSQVLMELNPGGTLGQVWFVIVHRCVKVKSGKHFLWKIFLNKATVSSM